MLGWWLVLASAAALKPAATPRREVLGAAARAAATASILAPRRAIASPLDPTAVGLAAAQSFKEYRYRAVAARRFAQLRRVTPPMFIAAALGDDRDASAGDARGWALWRENPAVRGVRPRARPEPTGAACGGREWWFEEKGLLLERPDTPLPAGTYLVTGGRAVTAALTVVADAAPSAGGATRWDLADGARIGDVALLASRVARYTPSADARRDARTPPDAWAAFPVAAGAAMPAVVGCDERDYAILLVVGIETAVGSSGGASPGTAT